MSKAMQLKFDYTIRLFQTGKPVCAAEIGLVVWCCQVAKQAYQEPLFFLHEPPAYAGQGRPDLLLITEHGRYIVNYCPFCGAPVELVERSRKFVKDEVVREYVLNERLATTTTELQPGQIPKELTPGQPVTEELLAP